MRDNRKSAMALVSFFTRPTSATHFGHSPATAGDVKELSWICPTGNAHISTTSNHQHPRRPSPLETPITFSDDCTLLGITALAWERVSCSERGARVWVWSIGCERQCFSDTRRRGGHESAVLSYSFLGRATTKIGSRHSWRFQTIYWQLKITQCDRRCWVLCAV